MLYAPSAGRLLAHVRAVPATPRTGPRLLHSPAALARLVDESASIRAELDARHFESALERAWLLRCALERLPAAPDVPVDRSREALVAVETGKRRPPISRQCDHLAAALARFEATLVAPARVGFR